MKSKLKREYVILKRGYIYTIIAILIPFICRAIYTVFYSSQPLFGGVEDFFEIVGETLAIFLLGFWGLRTINLMKRSMGMEDQYQKEKEETNKKFIEHMMQAQEKERKRIARELHDSIGQNLNVIKMNMEMAHKKEKEKNRILKDSKSTISLIDESISEIKNLSMDVRPNVLDDYGLIPALKWYVKNCSAIAKININLKSNMHNHRLSSITEINIYRIIQEAVSNAIKHGKANTVNIFVKIENSLFSLSIIDNGNGFNFEQYRKSRKNTNQIGIISIQERVSLMDGIFNIDSEVGKGTNIEIKIPVTN